MIALDFCGKLGLNNGISLTDMIYKQMTIGTWRSLVAHLLWEQGVAGSNPVIPRSHINFGNTPLVQLVERRFPKPDVVSSSLTGRGMNTVIIE